MAKRSATEVNPLTVVKPYTYHGATFSREQNGQLIGDCPICGKDGHFYVNLKERPNPKKPGRTIDSGAFDCKTCGSSGGVQQFLASLWKRRHAATRADELDELAALRKIPAEALKAAGMAFDNAKRWLMPLYDFAGKLVNLYTWDPTREGAKLLSTASVTTSLYWVGETPPPEASADDPIYLCEGEWDAIALYGLMRKVSKGKMPPGIIMAVHGAGTFDASLLKYFAGRDVILLYDLDEAGFAGVVKHGSMLLEANAKSVKALDWTQLDVPEIPPKRDGTPGKWDIRDHLKHHNDKKAKGLWDGIVAACVDFSPPVEEGAEPAKPTRIVPTIDKFQDAITEYKKRLHLTENMIDGIAVMFATAFAGRTYGDPLWLFIVGPPGSGKSATIKSFCEAHECTYTSTFKARALVSGAPDGDPSLLKQWPGKAVFVKDFTAVKSLPQVEQEEIYGILRDAFDGKFHRQFGNSVERNYDPCFFSLVCGVTDVIHSDQRAELGERFLKYDWIRGTGYDPVKQMRAAISGMNDEEEGDDALVCVSKGFMQRDFDYQKTPKPTAEYIEKLIALAQVTAYLRTRKPHGMRKDEDLAYRLRPEVPTRIVKQLSKLGRCLAFVYGEKKWTPRIYQTLFNVAMDTSCGHNQEIFIQLAKGRATRDQVKNALRFSLGTVGRRLDEMVEIGYVNKMTVEEPAAKKKETAGRPATIYYSLTTESLNLWNQCQP